MLDPARLSTALPVPNHQNLTTAPPLAVYSGVSVGLGFLAFRRQFLRPELEGELVELACETERHLIIFVVHRRSGVHTNVEGFVDGFCSDGR